MGLEESAAPWDPESTAAFWVNRASRALVRHFDARLRPMGFAMSHLPILHALAGGRALSQTELAQIARVEQPSMTETIARMVRDGVVERAQSPDDKRRAKVTLTRRARALFPRAKAALIDGEREAMTGFTDEEKTTLRQLLQRVVQNLEASPTKEVER